jgi:hypothetical protein
VICFDVLQHESFALPLNALCATPTDSSGLLLISLDEAMSVVD